jgi:hypothetical protein
MSISELQEKISNAKALDFGTILSESIELFKKTWLQGFLLQLFNFVIALPFIIILYIPLIGFMVANAENGYNGSDTWSGFFAGMSVFYILFLIAGIFVLGAVQVALNAAFFRIMKKLDHNETTTTNDFFYFLKSNYLSKAFMLMIVSILISIPAIILCYIPFIYVIVPMSYFAFFFAFNPELSVGDIVKASFGLGNKKWLLSFGLLIVTSILSQIVGLLLCVIGVLFTAAFIYHPTYLIYKHVVGFDESNDEGDIQIIENL